jgi:hypothetical protein
MPGINRTSVINEALRLIGSSQITLQASASSPVNSLASAVFTSVLRLVLAEHPWGFAMKYYELSLLSTAPLIGYAYAYQVPSDCVRIYDCLATPFISSINTDVVPITDYPKATFELVGGSIYTNASPCYARYTQTDCESYAHEPFIETLSIRIAIELSQSLASGGVNVQSLEQRYVYILESAKNFDVNTQNIPRPHPASGSNFIRRRFGYERFEDR